MPTARHLTKRQKSLMVLGSALLLIGGVFVSIDFAAQNNRRGVSVPPPGTALLEPKPTDTVLTGAIDAVNTGQGQDELTLIQKDGDNVTGTTLIIDEQSYCNMGSGGVPCMAMNTTYSAAFGGKRALVDGNKEGDAVRVRRLRIYDGEDMPRVIQPGTVYLPWPRVQDMIAQCEISFAGQTHEGVVGITTKNGTTYTSIEPVIDAIFTEVTAAQSRCGSIPLATE